MSTKFTLVFLTFIFNALLSTPTFARPCDDGHPSYNGCDLYGRLCKNGRVIGTCSTGNQRLNVPQRDARDSGVEDNLSQLISNHRFESDDGFYALDFGGLGTDLVEITVGGVSESSRYIVTGQEIIFVETSFAITRSIWLINDNGLGITSGDLRAKLKRVD